METVRKPNTDAGLIVIHLSGFEGDTQYTETRVVHVESGQFLSARLRLDPELSDQSLGKSLTYFRRYSVMGLLGIVADEDTDGQEVDDEQRTRKSVRASAGAKPSKADKADAPNASLGLWWASCQDVMKAGGIVTDAKKQRAVMSEMVGAAGYESSKELSQEKRNTLLSEVRRLYGPS